MLEHKFCHQISNHDVDSCVEKYLLAIQSLIIIERQFEDILLHFWQLGVASRWDDFNFFLILDVLNFNGDRTYN